MHADRALLLLLLGNWRVQRPPLVSWQLGIDGPGLCMAGAAMLHCGMLVNNLLSKHFALQIQIQF
jgi:hypothetical protein